MLIFSTGEATWSHTYCLVQEHRSDICAFGTDGEKAFSTAFQTVFRQAVHLRCFLHFKGNLEAKLGEFSVPKHAQIEFIRDVFGDPVHFQDGLVDAEGDDFEAKKRKAKVVVY